MADNNKRVTIIVDGVDNTKDAFNQVQKNLKETEKSTSTLGEKLGSLGKSSTALGKKMSLFATAPIVALGGVAVKSGAELKTLEESYARLTEVNKINGDEMLSKMKEVSKGTISNKDLILAANKAMSLGVVKDTGDIATIMEVARVKGQNMGLSMTQAFDDLVTGLGRGSAMILDNLGITVKVGEVNEAYAKSLGKTVQELTAQEQKQALVNAVIGQGKTELEAMGEVGMTEKEKMEKFTTTMTNFKDEIGKQLLPVVTQLMEKATVWIEKFGALDDRTKKIILIVAGLVAAIGPLLIVVGTLVTALSGLSIAIGFLASPIGLIVLAIAGLIAIGVLLYKNWDTIKWAANEFWTYLKEMWGKGVDWLEGAINKMIGFFDNLIAKIKSALEWLKKYSGYNAVSGAIGSVFGGGKATGGFVRGGTSYLVGEQGPELFTPSQSGNIVPNGSLGGRGTTINISVSGNTLLDRQAGEKIGDQIIRKLKLVTNI